MRGRSFRSFAKINLGLEVVGKLPSGYHELKTLFATISLHDIVTIGGAKRGIALESDDPDIPNDERNLAHRAALAMQRLANTTTGVSIRLRKKIPAGGGLGGGSSNAAAVLRALDLIWDLGLGAAGLVQTAQSLGADVPYFLFGGPALGLGRGDIIQPLDLDWKQKILLVPGSGGVSTAAVFARYAKQATKSSRSPVDSYLRAPTPVRLAKLRNDLQPAALAESPILAETARRVKAAARTTGATYHAMSGSGSSFFMLFDDVNARREAADALRAHRQPSIPCSFVSRNAFLKRFELENRR